MKTPANNKCGIKTSYTAVGNNPFAICNISFKEEKPRKRKPVFPNITMAIEVIDTTIPNMLRKWLKEVRNASKTDTTKKVHKSRPSKS